jgi:hypothetical protein
LPYLAEEIFVILDERRIKSALHDTVSHGQITNQDACNPKEEEAAADTGRLTSPNEKRNNEGYNKPNGYHHNVKGDGRTPR